MVLAVAALVSALMGAVVPVLGWLPGMLWMLGRTLWPWSREWSRQKLLVVALVLVLGWGAATKAGHQWAAFSRAWTDEATRVETAERIDSDCRIGGLKVLRWRPAVDAECMDAAGILLTKAWSRALNTRLAALPSLEQLAERLVSTLENRIYLAAALALVGAAFAGVWQQTRGRLEDVLEQILADRYAKHVKATYAKAGFAPEATSRERAAAGTAYHATSQTKEQTADRQTDSD